MKKIFIYFLILFVFLKILETGLNSHKYKNGADIKNEYGLIEISQGDPKAPKTVILYSSLACYYSRKFLEEVYPIVSKKYVDTGKIRFIFREFYIPKGTEWAIKLARIGNSTDYLEFLKYAVSNKVFENSSKPNVTVIDLVMPFFASRGYSKSTVEKCLQDDTIMTNVYNAAKDATTKYKIDGAPAFVYNNKVHMGMPSVEIFDNLVEKDLFGN